MQPAGESPARRPEARGYPGLFAFPWVPARARVAGLQHSTPPHTNTQWSCGKIFTPAQRALGVARNSHSQAP
jgi:hypothetical protein